MLCDRFNAIARMQEETSMKFMQHKVTFAALALASLSTSYAGEISVSPSATVWVEPEYYEVKVGISSTCYGKMGEALSASNAVANEVEPLLIQSQGDADKALDNCHERTSTGFGRRNEQGANYNAGPRCVNGAYSGLQLSAKYATEGNGEPKLVQIQDALGTIADKYKADPTSVTFTSLNLSEPQPGAKPATLEKAVDEALKDVVKKARKEIAVLKEVCPEIVNERIDRVIEGGGGYVPVARSMAASVYEGPGGGGGSGASFTFGKIPVQVSRTIVFKYDGEECKLPAPQAP